MFMYAIRLVKSGGIFELMMTWFNGEFIKLLLIIFLFIYQLSLELEFTQSGKVL